MTLAQLVEQARAALAAKLTERAAQTAILNEIRDATADGRDLTADEATRADQARGTRVGIDAEATQLRARFEELTAELAADQAAERLAATVGSFVVPGDGQQRQVSVNEKRTYSRDSDPKGLQFLRDVAAASFMGDWNAQGRLQRHTQEETHIRGAEILQRANTTTVTSPGLVIPQYLVDMYAIKAQAGRKFADQCRHHDLPETGMTVYIPRQTTSVTTALQASEDTTVSETGYTDELISISVRTNAGSQTVSRQSIERSLGTEDYILEDLFRSYNTTLDSQLINAGTWGLAAVATTNTWTDASPTAPELYGKIQESISGVEAVLLDVDEDDIFTTMHGRRWAWLKAQQSSTWPFINQGAPGNSVGTSADNAYRAGIRGYLPDGGSVVTDNNIVTNLGGGTNQDEVYVVARQEAHLWEDPKAPYFIRAEQTQAKKLDIDLVIYGYFAALFNRQTSVPHRKITGTGLVTPVF